MYANQLLSCQASRSLLLGVLKAWDIPTPLLLMVKTGWGVWSRMIALLWESHCFLPSKLGVFSSQPLRNRAETRVINVAFLNECVHTLLLFYECPRENDNICLSFSLWMYKSNTVRNWERIIYLSLQGASRRTNHLYMYRLQRILVRI